jgi:hypothetical protein
LRPRGRDVRLLLLRRPASRPQLKRDPLGGTHGGSLAKGYPVSIILTISAAGACAHGQPRIVPDPLAPLPEMLAPKSPLTCQAVPDTLSVEFTATGPLFLCNSPSFVMLRDRAGQTVWLRSSWQPGPEPAALATRDSLAQRIAVRYGQPMVCADERRVWRLNGYFLELRLGPTFDVVRPNEPWSVRLDAQVGASPQC